MKFTHDLKSPEYITKVITVCQRTVYYYIISFTRRSYVKLCLRACRQHK